MDKTKNPVFQNAEAEFYLAYKDGKVVGRIAAIVNWVEIEEQKKNKLRFGWYDTISDAVGDKLEIILDGGVRRGTHVLKALAAGATACSFGKMFLFSLAAGGQQGVEHLLQNMHDEINRNMVLMGCKNLKELNSSKLIYRNKN